MPSTRPILLLDFDGVIHQYTSPWSGADKVNDGPVPGAKEFIAEAGKIFELCIYSARSLQPGGIEAMKAWLDANGFPLHLISFPTEKPPAFLTIDDRCICFNGSFPEPEELRKFQPWNKRGV